MGFNTAIQNEMISVIDIESASPFSWFDWWNYWSNAIFIIIFIAVFILLTFSYQSLSKPISQEVKQIEDVNVDMVVRQLLTQKNGQNVLEYNNGA